MKYLYPCLPKPLSPNNRYFDELDHDIFWIAEIKRNGWRCLIEKDNDKLILWTRHHTLVTMPLKSLRESLSCLPDGTMLDGELINYKRIKGSADSLYLFDILYLKNQKIYHLPLRKRRGVLELAFRDYLAISKDIELAQQVQIGKKALYYKSIEGDLNEGIVLKQLDAAYPVSEQKCLDCPQWIKVKKVEKHAKREVV